MVRFRYRSWAFVTLVAVLLLAGCKVGGDEPLRGLDDEPSTSASDTLGSDDSQRYACAVQKIMTDTTRKALPRSSDPAALAGIYRDAATKIRGLADQAGGSSVAASIGDIAVAVDQIAQQLESGSLDAPDATLTPTINGLPPCLPG